MKEEKSKYKCAGCGDCLNTSAKTGDDCVNLFERDCPCHFVPQEHNQASIEDKINALKTFGYDRNLLLKSQVLDILKDNEKETT